MNSNYEIKLKEAYDFVLIKHGKREADKFIQKYESEVKELKQRIEKLSKSPESVILESRLNVYCQQPKLFAEFHSKKINALEQKANE